MNECKEEEETPPIVVQHSAFDCFSNLRLQSPLTLYERAREKEGVALLMTWRQQERLARPLSAALHHWLVAPAHCDALWCWLWKRRILLMVFLFFLQRIEVD